MELVICPRCDGSENYRNCSLCADRRTVPVKLKMKYLALDVKSAGDAIKLRQGFERKK